MAEEYNVSFKKGNSKTYVARVYKEVDGEKIYSDYSNELVLKDSLLTIEQVVNKVNEGLDELNQLAENEEDKLIASVDSENNKIVFTSGGESLSFDYTDEYITYSDLETVITEDNVLDNFGSVMMMAFVQNSIIELSGYENKTVTEFAENEEDYPKYGIMYIGEDYDFSKDDEDGNHITNTGTYIRKFKITLNKDIISKTVEEYGEDIEGSVPSGLAPTIIVGEVTENSVELSGKVEGSSEDDEYTCFFYRSKNKEDGFSLISDWAFNCTAGEISFDDDGLEPNTNYYYKAIINGGDTYSDVVVVKTKAANKKITKAPTVKTKNGNNNTIELSWNKVDGANTYEVLRSEKKNGKYKTIKKGLKENKYINTGVTYGKTYYYKVKAVGGKNSKTSSIVTGVAKPNKVNNLRFTGASTNNVKLSWDKVNVTGYEIYRSTNKKSWSKISTATKNSLLSLNNKKLKANTTYYYKVRAYKKVSGKKVYGPYSNVVTTKTAPSKPKVTVSVRDYKSLNVKITSVKGASKYEIYRSTSKTGSYEYMDDVTTSLTYKDENLETGKTYYYKVKACNSKGHCSGYTDIKSKKVTPKTPSMNLQSPETKVITVTLGEVNGADGYIVERSTSKKGKYTIVKKLTSEDELIFDDATKKGTTYYYKARSYTLVNGKEVYSDYTSIKSRKSN